MNIMSHLTRTANTEQQVFSIPWVSLLSFLIPGVPRLFDGEPSMYNFYTGILVLVTLPCVVRKSNQHKLLFGGLAAAAFLMCLGKDSPLYMLLHKFAPMYGTFRFPTVNRIFMSLFLILLLVQGLERTDGNSKNLEAGGVVSFFCIIGSIRMVVGQAGFTRIFRIPLLAPGASGSVCGGSKNILYCSRGLLYGVSPAEAGREEEKKASQIWHCGGSRFRGSAVFLISSFQLQLPSMIMEPFPLMRKPGR